MTLNRKKRINMKKQSKQKGSALILALILVLVLSVMATSMMFLSQSETWGSMNYRLMTQARYGAESGLHAAANYLMFTYQTPGTNATDPLAPYGSFSAMQPVLYNNTPVMLSSITSGDVDDAPNYPAAAVQADFLSKVTGSVPAGATAVNYSATATLLTMESISVFGSATPQTVQTWLLTGRGTIAGVRNSTVEVSSVMEQLVSPMFNYAAFAKSNTCAALDFSGSGGSNSYDSSAGSNALANPATGGNVGTNGAVLLQGSATIGGNVSAPHTGVSTSKTACPAGTVDTSLALVTIGNGTLTGSVTRLPQPLNYPTLTVPPPGIINLNLSGKSTDCLAVATCTFLATAGANKTDTYTLPPGSYGDIQASGTNTVLNLTAGTYNINAICSSSSPVFNIVSGPIILNITGNPANLSSSTCANPIDFSAQTIVKNSSGSWDPGTLQMIYEGTGTVNLAGGASGLGLLYAPNASVNMVGGSAWYGSIIGNTINDNGGTAINYDRNLQNEYFTRGNYMLHTFNWSKN